MTVIINNLKNFLEIMQNQGSGHNYDKVSDQTSEHAINPLSPENIAQEVKSVL